MGGFTSNSKKWLQQEEERLDRTAKNMAQTMVNRGKMLAPVDSGDLVESGRVIRNGKGSYSAAFGGSDVDILYALRREYENNKNPQTKHYMKRSGDSVKKQGVKPFYKGA